MTTSWTTKSTTSSTATKSKPKNNNSNNKYNCKKKKKNNNKNRTETEPRNIVFPPWNCLCQGVEFAFGGQREKAQQSRNYGEIQEHKTRNNRTDKRPNMQTVKKRYEACNPTNKGCQATTALSRSLLVFSTSKSCIGKCLVWPRRIWRPQMSIVFPKLPQKLASQGACLLILAWISAL